MKDLTAKAQRTQSVQDVEPPRRQERQVFQTRQLSQLFLCGLCLASYFLPFWEIQAASLSLNGYDLAEWTAIHPFVQNMSPALLTAFFIRILAVGLVGLLLVELRRMRLRWIYLAVSLVSGIALMPPLEFFSQATGDANYRQQFAIALSMWIGSLLLYALTPAIGIARIQRGIAASAGVVLVGGLLQVYSVIEAMQLQMKLGLGPMIVVAGLILMIAISQRLTDARS
jgi:hypothetical protein